MVFILKDGLIIVVGERGMKNTAAVDAVTFIDSNKVDGNSSHTEIMPLISLGREAFVQRFPSLEGYNSFSLEGIGFSQSTGFEDGTTAFSIGQVKKDLFRISKNNKEHSSIVAFPGFSENPISNVFSVLSIPADATNYTKKQHIVQPKEYAQSESATLAYNDVPIPQEALTNSFERRKIEVLNSEEQRQLSPLVSDNKLSQESVLSCEEPKYSWLDNSIPSPIGSLANRWGSTFYLQEGKTDYNKENYWDKENVGTYLSQQENTDSSFEGGSQFSNISSSSSSTEQPITLVTTVELDGQILSEVLERYISNQSLRT